MGHHDSSISQPGSFNPYLEGMSYPGGGYGLYPHHFSKLRGPHDLNGAYADYPSKPQQAVPTYKWMQVKRNVPKPGRRDQWLLVSSVFSRNLDIKNEGLLASLCMMETTRLYNREITGFQCYFSPI